MGTFGGHLAVPRLLVAGVLCCLLVVPVAAVAEGWTDGGSFDADEARQMRAKLSSRSTPADQPGAARKDGWRSMGDTGVSSDWVALDEFERGTPGKRPPRLSSFRLPAGSQVDKLYALIAFAESPKAGYDAIHHSARRLTSKRPTEMTLGEIKRWIAATPGQHHAIGRYQIIPSTLVSLQRRLGMSDATPFNRATQNRMAALLLADAGYHRFMSGQLSRDGFMDNLAGIWAGFPLANGKSVYHGYAGNRATVTRAFFDKQMAAIFSGEAVVVAEGANTAPQTQSSASRMVKRSSGPVRRGEDR
ncbi:hypothetical protein [Ruegeria sp. HKCCD8929]|uniref:hypothetical protein n=1 Tax=Ruegeria sp. HKCCD8929 TaxID=2683006 RepID=UPI001488391D|nr:hypothetical protein [Ruegeria sp. HKCCD8929]